MENDTPDTVYECPVCQEGLPLKQMAQHLGNHVKLHKHLITTENESYIRGLLDVIKQVVEEPKQPSLRRKEPVPRRKRYFTQYWSNTTWQREAARDEVLEHTAGNQFRKNGVSPGDEIYIVTVLDGKLMLGGKIFVEKIVGMKEAARIFGVEPKDLWDAKEHVIAGDEYAYDFDPHNEVPRAIARIVTIINSDGERGLKLTRDGAGTDPQTIRGVCELTKYSAAQLDSLL